MRKGTLMGTRRTWGWEPSNLVWEPVRVEILVGKELTLLSTAWARLS